jgi:hypothetical protein
MAIEFFDKEGKGFAPKVSIRQHGQIGLNQGAINRYEIKDGQYALLGYEREKRMVVIKVMDEREKGAKRILVRAAGNSTSGSISAKGFLDYFQIPYAESMSFPLEKDKQLGFLFFHLKPEGDSAKDV